MASSWRPSCPFSWREMGQKEGGRPVLRGARPWEEIGKTLLASWLPFPGSRCDSVLSAETGERRAAPRPGIMGGTPTGDDSSSCSSLSKAPHPGAAPGRVRLSLVVPLFPWGKGKATAEASALPRGAGAWPCLSAVAGGKNSLGEDRGMRCSWTWGGGQPVIPGGMPGKTY